MVAGLGMRVAACLLAVALAGCSGGTGSPTLYPELFSAGKAAIAARAARRSNAANPPLTRALLDTVKEPYIEVTLENHGITGYLNRVLARDDESPGRIEQWRTTDAISLSFRNGVLVATRGMGGDLVSAEVLVADGAAGPVSGGERGLHLRSGDLQVVRLGLACDLEDLGPETVTIVELSHPARHLRETCISQGVAIGGQPLGQGRVVNDYWVDPRRGIMWMSRQWAGPDIGYLRIRRLIE